MAFAARKHQGIPVARGADIPPTVRALTDEEKQAMANGGSLPDEVFDAALEVTMLELRKKYKLAPARKNSVRSNIIEFFTRKKSIAGQPT